MPRYIIEANAMVPLGSGDPLKLQGLATVFQVVESIPGTNVGSVETGLDSDQSERLLQDMARRGEIANWREEITGFVPLGVVYPYSDEGTIREHFPTVGVPKDALIDMVIGIADTGTPPMAAQEGPLSEYEISTLDSQVDGVGHATGVASCTFARRLVFAQALPGGSGSESTIASAIRRLADANVEIINLSLGYPGQQPPRSSLIDAAVVYAQSKGIPCGAAAGNSGWTASYGSPQAVCQFVWGATTLDGKASAPFSSGGSNWEIETGAVPGQGVGVAHLDGGYGVADGTSFSAPLANSMALALFRHPQVNFGDDALKIYIRNHQNTLSPPKKRGMFYTNATDIGYQVEEPPVVGDHNTYNWDIAHEVQRIVTEAQQVGWDTPDMQSQLGSIHDYMNYIKEMHPKADTPKQTDSFGGTYGPEHGLAFDLYPNGEDGPHKGYVFKCPAAGKVSRYSFGPGPLGSLRCYAETDGYVSVAMDVGYLAGALLNDEQWDAIQTLGTYMHIAVLQYDVPQDGVRAIWIGHVRDGFVTGHREKGQDFCVCWNSGVEFPGCDASHGHVCGTSSGVLSPNGDVPGEPVARQLGFNPRVGYVPGPQQYATGNWDKGKPKASRTSWHPATTCTPTVEHWCR
jgi:hypothetical protein